MATQWAGGSLPRCDGFTFRYAIYMHGVQLNEPVALFRTIEGARVALAAVREEFRLARQTTFMVIDLANGGEPS